ncbi:MAG: hypothetical protein HY543_00180 [Deltaproteobacteria bacterium]|nr:hypothetical protein [Deltaproteobacteria bacterium]
MREKFRGIFTTLDHRIAEHVREIRTQGGLLPKLPARIRIVGQLALILNALPFPVAGTTDVDALGLEDYWITTQFKEMLLDLGLSLETDHRLIWMPPKAHYTSFFDGGHLHVELAESLYVIASKCKFRRKKDQRLLWQFFSVYPDEKARVKRMGIDTAWVYR